MKTVVGRTVADFSFSTGMGGTGAPVITEFVCCVGGRGQGLCSRHHKSMCTCSCW